MAQTFSSSLTQLLDEVIASELVDVHVNRAGIIDSFDASKQLAKVNITSKLIIRDAKGKDTFKEIPLLIDLPVVFPQVQGFSITYPIKKGDECQVIFEERDTANFRETGNISEPRSRRRFDFSDGWVIIGSTSNKKVVSNYNSDNLEIRSNNGDNKIVIKPSGDIEIINTTKVDITSPTINLNGDVNVSKTLTVTEDINCNQSVTAVTDVTVGSVSLKNHIHSGVQSGPSNTGPPV